MPSQTLAEMTSALWLGLLHGGWIALVVAAVVAWIFHSFATIPRRLKRAILVGSLGLVVILPALLVVSQWHQSQRPEPYHPLLRVVTFVVESKAQLAEPEHARTVQTAMIRDNPILSEIERVARMLESASDLGLMVWIFTGAISLLLMTCGYIGMTRFSYQAIAADEAVSARAGELANRLKLRKIPAVRVHPTIDQPCLCGLFRPVVILPADWLATAKPESLDAVLAHELAHARRFDPLWNIAQQLFETLTCFHPAVRWLSRSLRIEREFAADAIAVKVTGDPLALARAIESVARICVGHGSSRRVGAALGGESPTLLPRIQELLGMTPTRSKFPLWTFASFAAAIVFSLVASSVGIAQEKPKVDSAVRPTAQTEVVDLAAKEQLKAYFRALYSEFSARPQPLPPMPVFDAAVSPMSLKVRMAKENDQISFEVRFIQTEPMTWRKGLNHVLKPTDRVGPFRGWIVSGKPAVDELVKSALAQQTSNMIQAPKVTAFASQSVMITKKENCDGKPTETTLKLTGTSLPGAIKMTYDVPAHLSHLGEVPDGANKLTVSDDSGNRITFTRPTTLRSTMDIPDGSSLILTLGTQTTTINNRPVKQEHLIVITPRHIVLEAEEEKADPKKRLKQSLPLGKP